MSSMHRCSICPEFAAIKYSQVLYHINLIHGSKPNFRVTCGLDSCPATYSNYESFRSHVYRKHRNVLDGTRVESRDCENDVRQNQFQNGDEDLPQNETEFFDVCQEAVPDRESQLAKLKECGAKFVLKMKENLHISQSAVQEVIRSVEVLFEERDRIIDSALKAEQEKDTILSATDFFDSYNKLKISPFDGLQTRNQQENYFLENFSLLVSTTVE